MKTRTLLALSLTTFLAGTPMAQAQGTVTFTPTAFSFTGRVYENGQPANNLYDFQFRLFEAQADGQIVGAPILHSGVGVSNGFFHVSLDFGANVFTGSARWLEIQRRVTGGGVFELLSDRLPVLSTPHSIYAFSAGSAAVASTVSSGGITAAALAPGSVTSLAIADGSISSGDLSAGLRDDTFWRLLGNTGTDPFVNFLGTIDNTALTIRVNDKPALRIIPDNAARVNDLPLPAPPVEPFESPNILGGFRGNSIHPDNKGATIAGGGSLYDHFFHSAAMFSGINAIEGSSDYSFLGCGAANYISGNRCVIVGGHYNRITNGNSSAIGGGEANLISILFSNASNTTLDGGFIGGGSDNTLSFAADDAVIGGGHNNTATNIAAFVGGGGVNLAGGSYSVIAGGANNRALGLSSVVAGGEVNAAIARQSSIGGGVSNVVNAIAGAIAGGSLNTVNAPNSTVGGGTANRVDASTSVIAGGQLNYIGGVSNAFAAILGGNANTNVAPLATVLNGSGVLADKFGQVAFGTRFATNGDAQASFYHLRGVTTANSLIGDLYLDGVSQRLKLTRHSGWAFRALVIGKAINNLSAAAFEVRGMVVNMDGATTVLATTTLLGSYTGIPGFNAEAVADDPNDALVIRVTSGVGATVRWSAQVETAEVNAPSTLF